MKKRKSLLLAGLCIALAGCATTTSPSDDVVVGCGEHLYGYDPMTRYVSSENLADGRVKFTATKSFAASEAPYVDALLAAIDQVPARDPAFLNVLILSGGGQWGAYGAGFLHGWSEAPKAGATYETPYVPRQEIDVVTGVSTGAMQTTLAYAGSLDNDIRLDDNTILKAGEVRARAHKRLSESYLDPNIADMIEARGLFGILFGNSLYSVDGLEKNVRDGVEDYFKVFKGINPRQRAYVGLVNADKNEFFVADLKGVADSKTLEQAQKKACLSQMFLGSAAIPIGFPPRFINGDMFIDGGTRLGLFATILFTHPDVADRIASKKLIPYFHVIINGNQSANSYAQGGLKPTKNRLLPIAKAAMRNVIDQLYRDSAYRNEKDLQAVFGKFGYASRYTYVSNDDITAAANAGSIACQKSVEEQSEDEFDPTFMNCLHGIGYSRGKNQATAWRDFSDIPAAPMNAPKKPARKR